MEILFASTNRGKYQEVKTIADSYGIVLVCPEDLLLQNKVSCSAPEVAETGSTYIENARLKAEAFYVWSGIQSLADDTGLEIEVLNGAPGLYSARYAGEGCQFSENVRKLQSELKNMSNRRAKFRCVLYLKLNNDEQIIVEDELVGEIVDLPEGAGGFGYDPIFKVQGTNKTLASLKAEGSVETHRTKALHKLFRELKDREQASCH